jgi:vancomycin permeability regulator SanA
MFRRIPKPARYAIGFGLLLYVAAIVALAWSGFQDEVERADVALVLGNRVNPDGSLSPRLEGRLAEALARYQQGLFPLIIVSGGQGVEGQDEATAMRRYLLEHGVPSEAIIADSDGVNTFASARNTRAILEQRGLKSVFVVTQYFHVPRSRLALHRFGVKDVYSSHARYFEWQDFLSAQREVFAYARYATRSYQ